MPNNNETLKIKGKLKLNIATSFVVKSAAG
jgi:hypothetical protein